MAGWYFFDDSIAADLLSVYAEEEWGSVEPDPYPMMCGGWESRFTTAARDTQPPEWYRTHFDEETMTELALREAAWKGGE